MATQKSKEEILAGMDESALDARKELVEMTNKGDVDYGDSLRNLAAWWKRWFPKAGHKRLAYILMNIADK